jgi:hypothetical protein
MGAMSTSSNPQRTIAARAVTGTHLGPVALFVVLCVAWTWPLVTHVRTALPGNPGDNYNFLWNFWWMRHVLATPRLSYFRTTFLFYPFGTNLANHSHTALLALIGATILRGVSIATALNVLLLATVFLNMLTMYALAWDLTRHRRAAVIAGVLFGTSPYLAVRLLGHFELMGAWVLPLFALSVRRAFEHGSKRASVAAGIVLTITAYIAYYYVVYLGLFALAYATAISGCVSVVRTPRVHQSRMMAAIRITAATLLGTESAFALVILITGGAILRVGSLEISARTPQNALSVAWLAAFIWLLTKWRVTVRLRRIAPETGRRLFQATAIMASLFLVGCSPLLVQAAHLVRTGEYATTSVSWRSAPRGVDLLAPLLGHPLNPFTGSLTREAYSALHLDYIEGVAWVGFIPLLLLFCPLRTPIDRHDRRVWLTVAGVFLLWAMGPFLTVGGFDTGLKLPEVFAQFIPLVSNAHMPGRAIVGAYLALATLVALRVSRAAGSLQRAGVQWLIIGLLAVEYTDAPIPLTALDEPAVYQRLAAEPAGGVCEAPFGVGDGLSVGAGAQNHVILHYATLHAHPLVGGFVGRMPRDAARRYGALPVTRMLLALSARGAISPQLASESAPTLESPCAYIVLDRTQASLQLVAYVQSLPVVLLASSGGRDLYRVGPVAENPATTGPASTTSAPVKTTLQ